MSTTRRVALIADAGFYVGPALARTLATRGHDLVLGNVAPELVTELEHLGAAVEAVPDTRDLADPATAPRLVEAGLARFGAIHAAAAFSGQIITGRFLDSTPEQLDRLYQGCMVAPYHFLKAVVAPMAAQRDGQVLMITSAAGGRPTKGAALYSAVRAGATMMARNVAEEVAALNVQVNAVGTNFMDFPGFLKASGATDPEVRAKIEAQVPQRRLGTMDEFANFCAVFLDGSSRFTTGQWVGYAGGWV
jgi:NAD(P)-dependent dehydrogenase (short-subunit alcohol dehydrogenase family)